MSAPYPFYGASLFYDFVEGGNALTVPDLSGNHFDGTLSSGASWTNLGLRLNGTQTITFPNNALVPDGQDFTVFLAVQNELAISGPPAFVFSWGNDSVVYINITESDGLYVAINGDGRHGHYFPRINAPFAVAVRLRGQERQLEIQVAEGYNPITIDTELQSTIYNFPANDGLLGANFTGTLISFAFFQKFCSNGQIREMFDMNARTLLSRGIDTTGHILADLSSFQAGAFQ